MTKRRNAENETEDRSSKRAKHLFHARDESSPSPNGDIDYVSATAIGPFIINDAICAWLKLHHDTFVEKHPEYEGIVKRCLALENGDGFVPYIKKRGLEFERIVDEFIIDEYPDDVVDIGAKHTDVFSEELFERTKAAIKKGTPIILSGVLKDEETQTHGIPDVIIKASHLRSLIKTHPKALKKIPNDVYVIVDIKFTTLKLCADGMHLLNEGMNPCYKAQTFIYSRILSKIQKYDLKSAFILSRGYSHSSKGEKYESKTFDILGVVDFRGKDLWIEETTDKAVKTLRRFRRFGLSYDPLRPLGKRSPDEILLYPNQNNTYDFPWRMVKDEIARYLGEITQIYRCSVKHRQSSLENGVSSIDDELCSSGIMQMGGGVVPRIVDLILEANRSEGKEIVTIHDERDELPEDISTEYALEFYVDFETISDVVSDKPLEPSILKEKPDRLPFLYMIGTYAVLRKGDVVNVKYLPFVAASRTPEAEKEMCERFLNFVKEIKRIAGFKGPVPMYHWGNAEKYVWDTILEKHDLEFLSKYDLSDSWINVHRTFESLPITVRGAKNFSLKSIIKALTEANIVPKDLAYSDECASGTEAMMLACHAYGAFDEDEDIEDNEYMKTILRYNEIDCRSIYEIVRIVRKV